MKPPNLVLICGRLSPGQDGVGDYTRRLASAWTAAGGTVSLVALRGTEAEADLHESLNLSASRVLVPVRGQSIRDALNRDSWRAELERSWVSVQFVPWTFGHRGIVRSTPEIDAAFQYAQRRHMMVHETWVDASLGVKNAFLGAAQRRAMRSAFKRWKPNLVHVSTVLNQKRLKSIGVTTNLLPLFGNIDISEHNKIDHGDECVKILFFGALPRRRDWQLYASSIAEAAKVSSLQINLVGASAHAEDFIKKLTKDDASAQIDCINWGKLPETKVSQLLQVVTLGVCRYGPEHIGKSGSLAAMLEHGLPVWAPKCPSDRAQDVFGGRGALVHPDLQVVSGTARLPPKSFLATTARTMLEDIASHSRSV